MSNEDKQYIDEKTAENKNVSKGTTIVSKIFPSEFSGNRSNVAKVVTSVKNPIPSSTARQQVDYYLNQLSNYIDWATSSNPDPLKTPNHFFPSMKRIITFQSARPNVEGGKSHKRNRKSKKNNKSKKGSQRNKNKTRKHK